MSRSLNLVKIRENGAKFSGKGVYFLLLISGYQRGIETNYLWYLHWPVSCETLFNFQIKKIA